MTVVFLCSSLQQGCDGVGDYTRLLAGELLRQGHTVTIIALNESQISSERAERQSAGGTEITVLRLSAQTPLLHLFRRVKAWIKKYDPDWISLQFVPFGFHKKGLPIKLTALLMALGRHWQWHIMFHELWVGMEQQATPKMYWWGAAQKQIIRTLLAALKPTIVHTQMRLYQQQLQRMNCPAAYLPLFSNIPVCRQPVADVHAEADIRLVNFGGLHPGAPVASFTHDIHTYAQRTNQTVSLTLIGRCGKETKTWVDAWQNEGNRVTVLGEQSPEQVSAILHQSTLGLTTNPVSRVEKSGTVAALLAHGLPVLSVAETWQAEDVDHDQAPLPGILTYKAGNLDHVMQTRRQRVGYNDSRHIAAQFISELSQ